MEKEWNIEQGQKRCASCEKEFAQEQEYFSLLFRGEGTFVRKDFCTDCWKGPDESAFSFWKTRMPVQEEKPKEFIDVDVIFDFFRNLGRTPDREKENFRYILALILMRKRKLKFESAAEVDGVETLTLREAATKNVFHVKNPRLTGDEIDTVTEKIGEILNMDL